MKQSWLLASAFAALVTLAVPTQARAVNPCIDNICAAIADLIPDAQAALAGVPGDSGVITHLEQALKGCQRGNLDLTIAQLSALLSQLEGKAPQSIPQALVDQARPLLESWIATLRNLQAGGPCIEALAPASLTDSCSLAVGAPFGDDFEGGAVDTDKWSLHLLDGAPGASITQSGGALVMETGAAAAGTVTSIGAFSACAYAPQDYTLTTDFSVDAGNAGDYIFGAVSGGGGMIAQVITSFPVSSQFGLGFQMGPPLFCTPNVSVPPATTMTVVNEFVLDNGSGQSVLTGKVFSGPTELCSESVVHPLLTDPFVVRLILTAQRGGETPVAVDTDATVRVESVASDLSSPVSTYTGSDTPLALNGVAYDSMGTVYIVGGVPSLVSGAPAPVIGLDGLVSLHAALVSAGSDHVTVYTDFDEASLAAWLGLNVPGAVIDAVVADVFVAHGAGEDYSFDSAALTAP